MLICEAVEPDGKTCRKCLLYKSMDAFYDKRHTKYSHCKQCMKEFYQRQRLEQPHMQKAKNLRNKFNLTLPEWETMWASQHGSCAICGDALSHGRGGHATDHDHATGTVRAILCNGCNSGLGYFQDSPSKMRAAANYVEAHRATPA